MKECTILGKGPTRVECNYDHGEIFALNDCYEFVDKVANGRIDRLYCTDGWSEYSTKELKQAKQKYGCEVITATPPPDPTLETTLYPIEQILECFKTKFFTNVVCYMLAAAIMEGYERIWFYGIDMMMYTTYVTEKGGVEYWMGVARGMGIDVRNTKGSMTGRTAYGSIYGDWGDKDAKIKEMVRDYPI